MRRPGDPGRNSAELNKEGVPTKREESGMLLLFDTSFRTRNTGDPAAKLSGETFEAESPTLRIA